MKIQIKFQKKYYGIVLVWLFILTNCNPYNSSKLVGEKLNLPKLIQTKRLDINNGGKRIIYWIRSDYTLDQLNVDKLINWTDSNKPFGMASDQFIITDIADSDQLKKIKEQLSKISIYSLPDNCDLFIENINNKGLIPSCILIVDRNYKVLSIYEMSKTDGNKKF